MVYTGNPQKIERILNAVGTVNSLIDVGCNYGYMAKAFLDKKQVERCYGVELKAETVNPELIKHPLFTLYEADLTTFNFPQKYDACIYTAVHHRLLAAQGKEVAMNVWRKIIRACKKTIIFETGIITEQGEDWTEILKSHYENDAEHLNKIVSIVGKKLKKIETIMEIPIRGTIRPVYKIELKNG